MKCFICGVRLKQDENVIGIGRVVENEKRSDFVDENVAYAHVKHFELSRARQPGPIARAARDTPGALPRGAEPGPYDE